MFVFLNAIALGIQEAVVAIVHYGLNMTDRCLTTSPPSWVSGSAPCSGYGLTASSFSSR